MSQKVGTLTWVAVVLLGITAACSFPEFSTPTPFVFPTPDLTLTTLFQPSATAPPTVTPPAVQTATPVPASPTPVESIPASPTPVETEPEPDRTRDGAAVAAVFLSQPPAIDGNLDDWSQTDYAVSSLVYGAGNAGGSQDLSGTVMLAWDEEYLYVAATVVDDTYAQGASGEDLYKGDSLEILIDTRLEDDFFVADLSPDDFQLGISPGSPDPGTAPEAYLWFPRSVEGRRTDVQIAARALGDGYQVELAVPWSVFDLTPRANRHYGFAFSISDNDNPNADVQQSMASNVATRRLTNPTTWGDLVLASP